MPQKRKQRMVLSVLSEHDVIVPKDYVQQGESVCDSGYHMTEQFLKRHNIPDAIICANNYITIPSLIIREST